VDFCHGDGFAGEDRVERSSELGVTIPDEEPELVGAVADLPQQLPGLLGDPGGGGVGGHPEDVHPASAHFHDEQCGEACECDRVDREEIRGQKPVGLSGQEGAPLAAYRASLWWGSETGAAQHPAYGGGAGSVSEAPQLAMDAAESPAGILDAESGDELAQFLRSFAPFLLPLLATALGGGGRLPSKGVVMVVFPGGGAQADHRRRWRSGSPT
jgi:hypothetical protein